MSPQEILRQHFGFADFRPPQEEVLQNSLAKINQILVMPTGGGKSLCYQLPTFYKRGLVLVVSPLIALMEDQLARLKKLGIRGDVVHSGLGLERRNKFYENLSQNKYDLVFATPERFRKTEFVEALAKNQIFLLAIDEAHCISQWGNDFRPDYARLGEIRQRLGLPLTLAMTATATPLVIEDINRQLKMQEDDFKVIHAGIARPNLNISVHSVYGLDEKIRSIYALFQQAQGSSIVYFSLIGTLEKVQNELLKLGVDCDVYHGQLPHQMKKRNQERFYQNSNTLMLATPAFGLGVDKPDIRAVMHAELPGSMEAYFQEIGRAGRDGAESFCHMLYDVDDISIQNEFINWSTPEVDFITRTYYLIKDHQQRLAQEGLNFIRQKLVSHRGDFRVETAVNLLEYWGCVTRIDNSAHRLQVVEALPEDLLESLQPDLRRKRLLQKLMNLCEWLKPSEDCRWKGLFEYFGESFSQNCGKCDSCLNLS